jgi:hypothetical protein
VARLSRFWILFQLRLEFHSLVAMISSISAKKKIAMTYLAYLLLRNLEKLKNRIEGVFWSIADAHVYLRATPGSIQNFFPGFLCKTIQTKTMLQVYRVSLRLRRCMPRW